MPLFLLLPCDFSFCFLEFLAHAFHSEAERRSRGNNRGRACAHHKTAHCHGKAADLFVILVSCFPASSRLSNLIIMFVFPVYFFSGCWCGGHIFCFAVRIEIIELRKVLAKSFNLR